VATTVAMMVKDTEEQAQGQRILVVDDEPNVRSAVSQMLRLSGFRVDEAECGDEALALARHATYDLVLSDIRMPGMDGHATMRAIRAVQPQICGLAMTGFADASSCDTARAAGFHSLLLKPFTFQMLLEAVDAALSSKT